MPWQALPDDAPLDHEALPPPDRLNASAQDQQGEAPAGFVPLPDNAQVDQPAPDDSGFTEDQMRAIKEYIPKAKDAADLERYSLELSGGKAKVGNAQAVLDDLKKGIKPEDFAWEQPTVSKDMTRPAQPGKLEGAARAFIAHIANAAAADYGPEVGGLIDTVLHGGDVRTNAAHERAMLEGESTDHGLASGLGELTGIGLTAPLGGAAADAANLGKTGRIVQTMGEGAAFGSGAAGPGERIPGAAAGAVLAPVAGAAVKGAMAVPGLVKEGAKTVLEGSPGLARRIIAKAIKDDANTPESIANDIASAHANDVPMALADTGENARGLLAAASRSSGIARTVARDALEERQSGLGDRVTAAIQRDLGPVANPHELADAMMTTARDQSGPLYERAYSQPVPDAFVEKLKPLLQRPSVQKALGNARRIAQEEGEDPDGLGLVQMDGQTYVGAAPSWKTLDYIKRGLDDVVEGYRDPTSGKLNLDTEGRAVNNTLRSYVKSLDAANPTYASARQAWGGQVSGINAMNLGRKALNMTADDLEARMRDMTPFEKEMFSLGTRRAMAETVQSKGDTADVVNALVGTGKKRAMLGRLFGDRQAFQRFVDTLGQEKEGWRTFKQSLLGSPTAANLADDGTLQAATMAADFAANGIPVGTAASKAIKFLGAKVGEKAQQKIASMLSNTDPAAIRELAAELRAQAQKRGVNVPRARLIGKGGGNAAALALPSAEQAQ